jgi:hypothetical protein
MEEDSIQFALKTFRWNLETSKMLGSKKEESLQKHLKSCGLTQEEIKEAKRIWDKNHIFQQKAT